MNRSTQGLLQLPSRNARQQADGKALWNEARTVEKAHFYTIGYSGRNAGQIVELAKFADVRSIIDIRFNPISMYKPELSKGNFSRIIEASGLNYVHLPRLGVPRHIRARAIATGSRQAIWDWYERIVVSPLRRNLSWFFDMADHKLAFMCLESDPGECHRHLLFNTLEEQGLQGFDL